MALYAVLISQSFFLLITKIDAHVLGANKKVNENVSASWRGVPIAEIIGADSPWDAPEFPKIAPAYNHTVLYHIYKSNSINFFNEPPVPQQGRDVWNKDFVRMPFSNQSLYPVEEVVLNFIDCFY